MSWSKMSSVPNPLFDTNGDPFSGAVLKAYLPGTTTSTSIAIDSDGTSPQASITANADGIWEVSGNEIIPHIDRLHKWGIFANATDAAANTPFYMGPFDSVSQTVDSSGSVSTQELTTATMANNTAKTYADGDVVQTAEFSTGNGGGGTYDVVLTSGVTPNAQDIIVGVADATISFVLRRPDVLTPLHLGAIPSVDSAANTSALRRWAELGGELKISDGEFLFDNTTPLTEFPADTLIDIRQGATLKSTIATATFIELTSKDNIKFKGGGKIKGTPGIASAYDGITVTSCDNFRMYGMNVTQFNGIGLKMESCTNAVVRKNRCFNNSIYGIQDKLGVNNSITYNKLHDNGTTDAGSNALGRGLVTWMVTKGKYNNNDCYNNTEYGLRVYSETGDASGTSDNAYKGNVCYGNGTSGDIEFYVFNESGLIKNNLFKDNIITIDGVVSTIGMSAQGTENNYIDNQIINSSNDQTGTAYQLFGIYDSTIKGGTVKGVSTVLGFSGTATYIPDGLTIKDITALEVASFIPSITYFGTGAKGHIIAGNKATHGGLGTDNGIVLTAWAEGQFELKNNTMDGFNKGFEISDVAVNVQGNTSLNSTTWGCEVITAVNDRVEMWGNSFDSGFPSSIVNMSTGRVEAQGSRVTSSNASPSSDSRLSAWESGDFCHKTGGVTVDANGRIQIGWICTVSGTAGTWEPVWASSATWV